MRALDIGCTVVLAAVFVTSLPAAAHPVPRASAATPPAVMIDARRSSDPVTQYEYGMFIEPIGDLIARTLWAEMLDDRKFYYPIVAAGKDLPAPQSIEGRPGFSYRKWRPIGADDALVMPPISTSIYEFPVAGLD